MANTSFPIISPFQLLLDKDLCKALKESSFYESHLWQTAEPLPSSYGILCGILTQHLYCTLLIYFLISDLFSVLVLQMSSRLLSFLQRTLERDPLQRASAFELLNHSFIRGTSNSTSLADMMKSFRHSVC